MTWTEVQVRTETARGGPARTPAPIHDDGDQAPPIRRPGRDRWKATVTVPEILASKGRRRLVMVTAADAPLGKLGGRRRRRDLILVGDSLAMASLGRPTHPHHHGRTRWPTTCGP